MQTAQHRAGEHERARRHSVPEFRSRNWNSSRLLGRIGHARAQCAVRASTVVMTHPPSQDGSQMSLRHRNHPVQAPRRMVPITRSQMAFAFGLAWAIAARKPRLQWNCPGASRRCVTVVDHVVVILGITDNLAQLLQCPGSTGVGRTFRCARRREPCSITTNTYSKRNVAVTVMKKSHARMAFAWFFRKVDQRWSPRGWPEPASACTSHGPWRDANSQLQQQLIGNALFTPQVDFVRHPAN